MRFVSYEVRPIRDFGEFCEVCDDYPEDADFWSLYGRLPDNEAGTSLPVCIGDFNTKAAAEAVRTMISG